MTDAAALPTMQRRAICGSEEHWDKGSSMHR